MLCVGRILFHRTELLLDQVSQNRPLNVIIRSLVSWGTGVRPDKATGTMISLHGLPHSTATSSSPALHSVSLAGEKLPDPQDRIWDSVPVQGLFSRTIVATVFTDMSIPKLQGGGEGGCK